MSKNSYFRQFFGVILIVLLVGVLGVVADAAASHIDLAARRAEREAAREARQAEREAAREQRDAEREAERAEKEAVAEGTACSCEASLKYARPSLQWSGGGLVLIPRVDVAIRTKGQPSAPGWSAAVAYDGEVSYTSDDVTVPGAQSFAGSKAVMDGSCSDGRYKFTGIELTRLTLADITRTLVGEDESLTGQVQLHAQIEGCGFAEENRAFTFTLKELGAIALRGWRTVR